MPNALILICCQLFSYFWRYFFWRPQRLNAVVYTLDANMLLLTLKKVFA